MPRLSAAKADVAVKERKMAIGFRLPQEQKAEMKFHHHGGKHQWIDDAIQDLLSRLIYREPDWTKPKNEDCDAFISLLRTVQAYKELESSTPLYLQESTLKDLNKATSAVQSQRSIRNARPLIVRAAISQRILLHGMRWDEVFPSGIQLDDEEEALLLG